LSGSPSATTNYRGSDLLKVFSTSTEFDIERTYDKFAAYVRLEHQGDWKKAAQTLAREGYGTRSGWAPEPAGEPEAGDWPTPTPIGGTLPPVEAFSEALLPLSCRALVQDVADRMQVPLDYPAVACVLGLAGVVSRRAVIQPKAYDNSWVVVPNLWGGIIGPPGFMKSPVMQAMTAAHHDALAEYAQQKEEFELTLAAWKEQYKANTKKQTGTPKRPDDAPIEPICRRLIVNDATFEALHETMRDNPNGLLVIRDELTGWLSQLDRPGREGERQFSLEAWNGNTGHTIDRIGRGSVYVPVCCLSILGGIQPGRLRSYLVDALKDGPSNDGLMQRFQVLVWPDTVPTWRYIDRVPDVTSEEHAARIFRRLVEWDGDQARFRFAPDAQELFKEWLSDLEGQIRADDLHPALIAHLSKYRKLMPALALLFELADRVSVDGEAGLNDGSQVNLEHTRQAAAWCQYLESHARRVYSCVVSPQLRAARVLADEILKHKLDSPFSARDVYRKQWSGLDTPEAVQGAVEVLQDAEWVRVIAAGPGASGGRPSQQYRVNPKLWQLAGTDADA
jgi:hypothetical protein